MRSCFSSFLYVDRCLDPFTDRLPASSIALLFQICPWNYPIGMWSWKIGPALAAFVLFLSSSFHLFPILVLRPS
jgi:hypothetical protein